MGKIVLNSANVTNAAKGLREIVVPATSKAADKLANGYRIDPPGMGVALSVIEAQYNATLDYHVQNLQVAVESIEAVANGLDITVRNYLTADEVNVNMMTVPGLYEGTRDGQSYGGGFGDTGLARTFTSPLGGDGLQWNDVDTIIGLGAQIAALGTAGYTAYMSPTYLPTPIVAALIVANGPSMVTVGRRLADIATTLETEVNKQFDSIATSATGGWEDASVVEYRKVITEMNRELAQMQKAVAAASTLVLAVTALLGAFWLAFISFTGPFFAQISALFSMQFGPQAAVVQPIIQLLGALASAAWLKATGTVVSVLAAAGTLILGVIKEFGAFQRFDEQGDHTPDLKQIQISWSTA
ncbi:hypothetical protein Val02_74900 [Virgisporangium aliadipatigenens]|uniref:Uncharacterized protein n=1 Tax=Virgisporangium aliadipatigenens TaxID=741659 RepID=A0A8J4DU98_9ACTN|nr:hypothetical protein [Virgisporangium aliadipatigenens]GIJ50604.1 hypothetical protein Val02_74900 [Virgisporangium aliadipatigenens]